MRIVFFILSSALAIALIVVLNSSALLPLSLGKFLSPQHGFWQNAEPYTQDFNQQLVLRGLKGKASVYLDDRLVPHIVADNEEDAYFIQGYLHAKFRLWQMEFQTFAAAGRISEIIGDKALNYDRGRRRLGMVYAAENMLKTIENDPISKSEVDSYTAGVNAYISALPESQLPIEYKLLGYKPERWNNLKTALFVKQMAFTLAGFSEDIPMTKARDFFGDRALQLLFPQVADSLQPIIPPGTVFSPPSVQPVPPVGVDSVYTHRLPGSLTEVDKPDPSNGSNNWAVSGAKTKSGVPILCNDPHLELSFPSIWYEMQMTTPSMNAYGVSFPGAPGVIIGFNDSIAFGFTNSGRDVMDYYAIRFKDNTKTKYWFDGSWRNTEQRIEIIKVKDQPTVFDTVAYTAFGPVMYDESFPASTEPGSNLAVRWKAHDASNELLMWHYLDRANNYEEYKQAISYFGTPAQNVVFASKSGDIAIWQQGVFPALWDRQGVYIMPGQDSSYLWQGLITVEENPHSVNPERGFVSSANQRPVDSTYPYFIPGYYDLYRGIAVNRRLSNMEAITPEDMMGMQNDNYNVFAETARPILMNYVSESALNDNEKDYLEMVKSWSLYNDINEKGATVFSLWFDLLEKQVWDDEFGKAGIPGLRPSPGTLTEALLRDSAFGYIDNINTPDTERIEDVVTQSFKRATLTADSLKAIHQLEWGIYKNTSVYHLLGNRMLPFARTGLAVGGGAHIINAIKHSHGPSWRMVVELNKETDAYVVYPGGQSGNPGSPYYDSFLDKWAAGEYYKAWFMKRGITEGDRFAWKMEFTPR